MVKFNIGDRVRTKEGYEGNVVDIFCNESGSLLACGVDVGKASPMLYLFDELVLIPKAREFSFDVKIDIAQNIVIATLYESVGGAQKPLKRGHGHIIHDGELGIAQAASYACRRLYESLGGTYTKGGTRNDH